MAVDLAVADDGNTTGRSGIYSVRIAVDVGIVLDRDAGREAWHGGIVDVDAVARRTGYPTIT